MQAISVFSSNSQQESEKAYFPERIEETKYTPAFCRGWKVEDILM